MRARCPPAARRSSRWSWRPGGPNRSACCPATRSRTGRSSVADGSEPPEGFVLAPGRGAFSTHNGPCYYKPGDGELVEQAFFALPRHANGVGLIHGGMLSGFMDGVLAAAAGRATRMQAITMHLSID